MAESGETSQHMPNAVLLGLIVDRLGVQHSYRLFGARFVPALSFYIAFLIRKHYYCIYYLPPKTHTGIEWTHAGK